MEDAYQIVDRAPTVEEYRAVCAAVGWESVINFDAARTSLPNSLFAVVALYEGEVVGMGRIVGDGAIFFYIQDIAVVPEHQNRGVGSMLMVRLMAYLRDHAPEKAFIGIFAAAGTPSFYQRYGFRDDPVLTGIFQVVPATA
jgi:ribosomal protein S18 acetylase RimI-like enzyme